jgi:hypothetical protein
LSWLDVLKKPKPIVEAPGGPGAAKLKQIKVKKVGLAFVTGGRDQFNGPDYDFEQIISAYNTDGYIRQALDKYIELMFKSGWNITGKNTKSVEYIKMRLSYMALASGQPTDQLFMEMGEDLVKFSNVFIAKSRTVVPGVQAKGVLSSKPVAGYFILPPTTLTVARDVDGSVVNWRQTVSGQQPIDLKPEDLVHIYYKKERGQAFGTPFLIPVLDDVKLLRQIEENVARLIYKYLHPLYKYKVGIAQAGYESDDDEIEGVKAELESMPVEGGIVLPERHDVEVVGANGEALTVREYLDYFENRVFTGLGVSAAMMGRSESTSRSSAEVMTSEMYDRVKAFQKTLSTFIDSLIITELLLEGGFDPLQKPEDMVHFQFTEIDLASKIAVENHAVQKFITNSISHDEFRTEIGMDPTNDYSKYFANLFKQTAADQQGAANQVANKDQPTNQNGTKNAPKTK